MSDASDPIGRPAKAPPPELSARAPRPRPVRVRRAAALVLGGAAAALVAGALAWSFVIAPHLRHAAKTPSADGAKPSEGVARPSEVITRQPANYAQGSASLPPPRQFGEPETAVRGAAPRAAATLRRPSPRSTTVRPLSNLNQTAARSPLLFTIAASDRGRPVTAPPVPPPADVTGDALESGLTPPRSPFEVKAGAIVAATLLNALDTARAGPVVAATTEGVYDTVTGRILLIPQGSRLIGRQDSASKYGDRRAFLVWERLILPNGKSLTLASEPAVDAAGATGVPGRPDRRILPLLQASLFAGAITTLGQAARDRDGDGRGLIGDAGDAAAIQAAQTGGRMIGRELDISPSIRLSAGAAVRVLVTHDLVLEPYAP